MSTIRDLLNKIKWSSEGGLSDCEILILHRGAPNDRRLIRGSEILDVAPRAMAVNDGLQEAVIPYHRVLEVRKGGETVWKKREIRGGNQNETTI